MSKRKKIHLGKGHERTSSGLSLSIIIPASDNPDNFGLCLDSLQKIRKPFEKDYEVILPSSDPGSVSKAIGASESGEGLVERGFYKILEIPSQTSQREAILAALKESKRKNILILDPGSIERSFNFDELFQLPEEKLIENNILIPEFREQNFTTGKHHAPMIFLRRSFAEYILDLPHTGKSASDPGSSNYQSSLFYNLLKLDIKPARHAISQINPFASPSGINVPFPGSLIARTGNFINWFFRIPLREIKTAPHRKYSFLDIPSYFRSLFVITAVLIAVILPIMSLDAGQSGDDSKHYDHAEKVYNYFATGGEDKSSLEDRRLKLNYYGQSIDLLTYIINKTFRIENEYEARHFIIALTGVLCILFAGLLARMLAGYRAGLLTMIMMFLAPRFLGHSMNNPMDVPFALGYVFTLYHTFRFLNRLPDFNRRHAVWIMLGIAFTTSIRIGGLLLIPYVLMFAGLYVLVNRFEFKSFSAEWFRMVWKGVLYIGLISIGGYLISLIPWPYGFQKPFKNPFEALRMMANISVSIKVLFEGSIFWSNKLPWYYISMNILYTVPVMLLAGFFMNPLLYPFYRKQIKPAFVFFLFFVVVFPLAYVVYKESNVYGGWRHLMFVFPAMAILSGVTWDRIIRLVKPPAVKLAIAVVLVGGIIHPLIHIVKNHPHEYIYFNELIGVKKAYGRFETDYYMHSLRKGTEWLIENVLEDESMQDTTVIVATNGSVDYYLRNEGDRARGLYTRYYDRGQLNWDYAIYFCNYIHPYQLKNGLWPPEGTIKTIDVNGVPVCAILKRESKEDLQAIQMVRRGDHLNGIPRLEEVSIKHPTSEVVKLRLAEAYLQTRQYDKVHPLMDDCLKLYPNYDKALNLKGIAYMEAGRFQEARATFQLIIRINYRFATAYHNLGLLSVRQQPPDIGMALNYFQQAIRTNSNYKPSYLALASIYRQQGRQAEAEYYENIANQL